jgi:hypothetical protein
MFAAWEIDPAAAQKEQKKPRARVALLLLPLP